MIVPSDLESPDLKQTAAKIDKRAPLEIYGFKAVNKKQSVMQLTMCIHLIVESRRSFDKLREL
jgi:hypothetical protein